MKSYRGFLLDADGTIFDYERAEKEALAETLREEGTGMPLDRALATYRAVNSEYWRMLERGEVSVEELKIGRFRSFLDSLGIRGDPASASAFYLDALSRKGYLLPHARGVLLELSRRARLCLITNGISLVQRGRLRHAGIEENFTAVLISEELGIAKPDPLFFSRALETLALPPGEVLCVGDNPSTDIAGAMAAGVDACWVSPHGKSWPGPGKAPLKTARDLREILDLAAPPVLQ